MGLLSGTRRPTRRESHSLKLVHPGGFVELHTNPIMASEVMKNNPRHCVTRPDIFRFPWVVVSPESILTPGNVFFIVPCHTIRHLLNQSTHSNTNTNTNTTLIKLHRHRFLLKHTNESFVDRDCHRHSHSIKLPCFKEQSSVSMSASCLKLTPTLEAHKQRNGGNKAQSFVPERPVYHSTQYTSRDAANPTPNGLPLSDQIPTLKSCLKKDKSHDARSRNLKVRFSCTHEDLNTTKICDSQSVEYGH